MADLQRRMDASFEAFKSSLVPAGDGSVPGAATTFRYPIDERASKAVHQGERALEVAGPYVTAFNREFKCIRFLTQESGIRRNSSGTFSLDGLPSRTPRD